MTVVQITQEQIQKFIRILARTPEPVEKPQSKALLIGIAAVSFLSGILCQACLEKFVLKGRHIVDLVDEKNVLRTKTLSFVRQLKEWSWFLYELKEFRFGLQFADLTSRPVSSSSSEEDLNVSPLTSARTAVSVGQKSDGQSVIRGRGLKEGFPSDDSDDSCWDCVTEGGFRRIRADGTLASAASSVNSRVGHSAKKR